MQVANVLMGLMLFPVSKNSILTSCFGIAWEQVIFVHVWMGQALLAVIFAHMVSWWVVYEQQAAFPQDILQVPMWYPANTGCAHDDRHCFVQNQEAKDHHPIADNYTVQLVTITYWAVLLCMGVGAQNWVRRNHFEVFYYLHVSFDSFVRSFVRSFIHAFIH